MTEWRDRVPVVTVTGGMRAEEVRYPGCAARTDEGGTLCVFEVEPERGVGLEVTDKVKRRVFGKVTLLASGMWETVEQEWEAVVGGLVTVLCSYLA
jgi:hypothetical protein